MDVLFVSYSGLLGGAERFLLDQAEGLEGELGLACPPGPLADAASRAGLRVVRLRPQRMELRASLADRLFAPLRIAAQAIEVRRALRELRPRVLVGWSMRAALSCALALGPHRGGPALVICHNDFLPGPLVARAVRVAVGRADRVLCASRALAMELDPDGRLGERLEAIRPGVDANRFAVAEPTAIDDAPQALLLGAVVAWKRPGFALEVVSMAARRLPGLRLTIAGGPLGEHGERLLAELRERAERSDLRGRVTFAGQLADPRSALASASCLLHCAEREPFGMVVIEALAAGRPVIAPAGGGPAEIVDDSCGRLYPPEDVEAAAEALCEVLSDPATTVRMGAAGRERAEREFSLDEARRRFAAVIAHPRPYSRGASGGPTAATLP